MLFGLTLNSGNFEDEFTHEDEEIRPVKGFYWNTEKRISAWVNVLQAPSEDPRLYYIHITDKKIKGALDNRHCKRFDEIDDAIEYYRRCCRQMGGRTFTADMRGDFIQQTVGKIERKMRCPCCGKWVVMHLNELIEVKDPFEYKRPLQQISQKEAEIAGRLNSMER